MTIPETPSGAGPTPPPPPSAIPPGGAWPNAGGAWTGAPTPGIAPESQSGTPPSGWGQVPPASSTRSPGRSAQPGLVVGVILVVVGGALLVGRVIDISTAWPVWLVVPGLAMLIGSLFIPPRGGLGLAIPGAMLAMVGVVLGVQEAYGLYSTWAYAWALVAPTAVGLATLVYGLAQRDRDLAADGLRTTLVGIALFIGFAIFFEGVIGLNGYAIANLDEVLPYLAIGFGVFLVVVSLFGGGRRRERRTKA